ncbi:MAG: ABC transporter ATP-binding protein [Chloroflexota bacterium]
MAEKMVDKALERLKTQLPYFPKVFALVWEAAQGWTLAWIVLLIGQGLLPVATVTLTRSLVDSLVKTMNTAGSEPVSRGLSTFGQPMLLLLLMALLLILSEVLRSVTGWVRTAQSELVQDHLSGLIHDQATVLDMTYYENPAYYNLLHQARFQAISRPLSLLENLGTLAQNMLTFLAMTAILVTYAWWLPGILLISAIPGLMIVVRFAMTENRWRLRNTASERRTRYYEMLLTDRESVAEIRLFGLGDHFKQAYRTIRQRLRTERIDLSRSQAIAELSARGFSLATVGLVLAWMVLQIVRGLFSLGDLAMFYQVFNQGQKLMGTLTSSARQIYTNLLFLENLFQFLALDSQIEDPNEPKPLPQPLTSSIRFQNITFRYPESERTALKQFDLTIPAGKIVAIVGENGAGKSTLFKLLCRFYDPQEGRVTIDDLDIREMAQAELRRNITVLFQQPVHYHASAAQNIELGDIDNSPEHHHIQQAAIAAGADGPIERLPEVYETLLGKWFGGAELSGGEWQRVALARAFLRQAPIIALDEPTSAMDSWAEADWMERFRALAAGRTALLITHRFTTAMQADIIHVMVEGKLIESGSHEELLTLEGHYADSWRKQMSLNNETDIDKTHQSYCRATAVI